MDSDSVNLGSNPGSPATSFLTYQGFSTADKAAKAEQATYACRTKTGTVKVSSLSDENPPLIYFASAIDRVRFPIKIGRTTYRGLLNRLQSLQTGQPYKLEFMFVGRGEPSTEKYLHREFAAIRLKGEWFKRTRELEQFIAELVSAYPDWRSEVSLPASLAPYEEPWRAVARENQAWAVADNLSRAWNYPPTRDGKPAPGLEPLPSK